MMFVAENKEGLNQTSPYGNINFYYSSDEHGKSGGCFYDYGAPKKASFTCYEKGCESEFVKDIVATQR